MTIKQKDFFMAIRKIKYVKPRTLRAVYRKLTKPNNIRRK